MSTYKILTVRPASVPHGIPGLPFSSERPQILDLARKDYTA